MIQTEAETMRRPTGNPPSWLVLLLAVACGVTVANLYYAQPLLALLRKDFGVGQATAGALITATQLGYAAGMVLLVPLGDRLENRRLVTVQLTFTTVALVVAGTAPTFWVLLVALLVIGMTAVVAQVLVPYAADLASDDNRGRVVGRVVSGLLTGILLSRVLSSLLADVTSWRVVYLGSAGLMACLVLTLHRVLPPREPTTSIPYGQLLRSTVTLFLRHRVLRRRALYQCRDVRCVQCVLDDDLVHPVQPAVRLLGRWHRVVRTGRCRRSRALRRSPAAGPIAASPTR